LKYPVDPDEMTERKAELISTIGNILTNRKDNTLRVSNEFGNFSCTVEAFDQFAIVKRDFETASEAVNIPFSCDDAGVQMIFSLDGSSFFNDRFNPFALSPSSHCINFFKRYDCTNLIDANSRQQDIAFRLNKSFYADLIAQHLSSAEDRLPSMIAQEKEFNTINQHLPSDAGVLGILQNILECPFKGQMKQTFIREHIRALLTLQLFHFNSIVSNDVLKIDARITARDHQTIHAIKEYIDKHFLNPASLESLSRDFGLNEFKLKHGFKLLFDISPMRYLQHKRLTFGLSLLLDTDKTIKEISDELGYSYSANFTTAFVKTFGKTPQQYRRKKDLLIGEVVR
jgi:AraC-like DNA-binding protein